MSSQPSSTVPSSTSPWLLLGIGMGAGVLGAAGAAAAVLYLQQPRVVPAPAAAAQGANADLALAKASPFAGAGAVFPACNSTSPPATPTLLGEPAAAAAKHLLAANPNRACPAPAAASGSAPSRAASASPDAIGEAASRAASGCLDAASPDWRTSSIFASSGAPSAPSAPQPLGPSARSTPQPLGMPPAGPPLASARSTPQPAATAPLTSATSGALALGEAASSGWPSRDSGAGSDACQDSLRGLPNMLRMRQAGNVVGSLELGALLGRGSFGKVYKGRWKGAMVAVKVIEHNECVASKLDGLRESVLSASIQHPNVLSTYKVSRRGAKGGEVTSPQAGRGSKDSANGSAGHHPADGHPEEPCFEEAQETWMLSEFCDRGNLDRAMSAGRFKNPDGTPNMEGAEFFRILTKRVSAQTTICRSLIDIAAGMDYLHSLGVLHADLKGGNVLLKSTSTFDDPRGFMCKVGDFGLSRVLETNSTHVSTNSYGTVAYMPAEMLKDGKMTKAVDVYSFAIIMLELFMGDMVFRGMSSSQARAAPRLVHQVFFKVLMGYRPPIPENMPQGFKDLLVACWDENPANRPPFEDIVRWLRKLYYSSDGAGRDNRRSLDLNPWATNQSPRPAEGLNS